ncbi:MAG: hypothetical protein N2558_05260, partial [Patescibacteria group bacterium]|nr:hypothetical protein [Patescibacteria group bacterium]
MANGLIENIGNANTDFTSSGGLNLAGGLAINTDKFAVDSSSGNTSVAGTLNVSGLLTSANGIFVTTNGIEIASNTPGTTTNRLYNTGGDLYWNGALVGRVATLNGLTATTQTFATGTSGTDFNISSSGSTHTFNIPNASATARGLVSTGAQTFAGAKTFDTSITTPQLNGTSGLVLSGGTGNITFSSHLIPSSSSLDIGSPSNPIRDLYVSNNSIKIGGNALSNSSGTLIWSGGAIQANSGSSSFDTASITTLNATTANITTLNLTGSLNVPGNFSVNTNKFNVNASNGNTSVAGTLSVSQAITAPTSGDTINGLVINSGALSGITTINMSGAITAATSTNTINGLVINSGALSGITG